MRFTHGKLAAALILIGITGAHRTALAAGGSGLAISTAAGEADWSPWQGRVTYGTAAPLWRSGLGGFESGGFTVKQPRGLTSVNLLGDYFFAPSLAPSGGVGGLRATSGLLIGTRSQLSFSQTSLPGGLFAPAAGSSDRLRCPTAPMRASMPPHCPTSASATPAFRRSRVGASAPTSASSGAAPAIRRAAFSAAGRARWMNQGRSGGSCRSCRSAFSIRSENGPARVWACRRSVLQRHPLPYKRGSS